MFDAPWRAGALFPAVPLARGPVCIHALISAGHWFGVAVLTSCSSDLEKSPVYPLAEAPEELAPWDRWLL